MSSKSDTGQRELPAEIRRDQKLAFAANPSEAASVSAAALDAHLTRAEWIRRVALDAAVASASPLTGQASSHLQGGPDSEVLQRSSRPRHVEEQAAAESPQPDVVLRTARGSR